MVPPLASMTRAPGGADGAAQAAEVTHALCDVVLQSELDAAAATGPGTLNAGARRDGATC